MTPAAAQALERIYVASSSQTRPLMIVEGAENTDRLVAHSTAEALRRRGLIELIEEQELGHEIVRAAITPAGVKVVVASRLRRAATT